MANNPYVNKVIYGDQTVIDLTMDTLTASNLTAGVTGHDRSGAPIVGTADYYSPSDTADVNINTGDYLPWSKSDASAKKKITFSDFIDKIAYAIRNLFYSTTGYSSTEPSSNSVFPFIDPDIYTVDQRQRAITWTNIKATLKSYFDEIYHPKTTVDNTPTTNSDNLVKSGGVKTGLDNKVITLTYAQYQLLSTAEKNDPDKVYYVTDYESHATYVELDDTTTAADKIWSSQKTNNTIAAKPSINDSSTSASAVWSSQKTNNTIAAKPSINDSSTSASAVWSSQKTKSYADSAYTLPKATTSSLGGVSVGTGLSVNGSGVLSLPEIKRDYVDNLSYKTAPITVPAHGSAYGLVTITDSTIIQRLARGNIYGIQSGAVNATVYRIIPSLSVSNAIDVLIEVFNVSNSASTINKASLYYWYF